MTYKTKKKNFLFGGGENLKDNKKELKDSKSREGRTKDKISGKRFAGIPGTRKGGIIGKEKSDKKKAADKIAKQSRKNAKDEKNKAIAEKTKAQTKKKLQSRKTQLMDMLSEDIEAKYGKEFREGQVGKATKGQGAQGQGAQGQGAQGQGAQGQGANNEDKTKGAKKSLIFLWAFIFGAIISFNLTKKEDRSTTNPF